MTPARQVLERLLARAERARAKAVPEQVELPMTAASCPEYGALSSLDELERFHAEIGLARRAGAIDVEQARLGDRETIKRLRVLDLDLLGEFLGVSLLSTKASQAATDLEPWLATYPVIVQVLEQWRLGRKVRGTGPESVDDLRDAIAVVTVRKQAERNEAILRRESVRLFGDSKRLEKLTPWLDVLTNGELTPSGLSQDDIWGSLGLRREPQPLLIAGQGIAELDDGPVRLCRPYIGLPADSVRSIHAEARFLLTIENLATFHDTARTFGHAGGLILYTAGMPSPSWRTLYAHLIASLPPETPIYHWGDIDEGGFRIAAAISRLATNQARELRPWCMSPSDIPSTTRTGAPPSKALLAQMVRWARRAGWQDVAMQLEEAPIRLEQEALEPSVPPA